MIQETNTSEWDDAYEADVGPDEEGLDLWGMVFRRKWLIVLGTVIGAVLALLLYARSEPIYQSSAQMLIQEKHNALPLQAGAQAQMQFVTAKIDHAFVLASPMVVGRAVQTQSLGNLPSLANSGNPVGAVRAGLSVSRVKNSANVLSLSFRGPNADDCPQILDAMMATYREFLISSETDVSQEAINLIRSAETNLTETLTKQIDDYAAFQSKAPLLWKEGEAVNIFQERQTQIEEKRNEVALRNSALVSQIRSIEASRQRGVSTDVLLILAGQNSRNFGGRPSLTGKSLEQSKLINELLPSLLIELKTLSQQYGNGHPKIKSVRRRIDAVREFHQEQLAQQGQEKQEKDSEAATSIDIDPDSEVVQIYLEALREQLALGEEELRELRKMSAAEQEDAERLAAFLAKDREHQGRIERTKSLFDAVVQRLQEINLIDDAVGGDRYTVQELSAAGRGRKVAPSLVRFAFSGVALGLLAGCGLAYVVDHADQRFRDPDDVSRALGTPLIGQIPEMLPRQQVVSGDSVLDPALITAHRPKSSMAESYRAVRTALYFSTHSKRHQVIQITSPVPGDGKSTLAANLAVTFAQSGRRVLLLDADFRRPVVHQRFGLSADIGLASVVDGQVEPAQAIQQSEVPNLWAMTCGPRPDNPSELLTSPRFEDLLKLVRDQFDFVLVDTPPLLAVTDPSVVAARVDGVVLTMRLNKYPRSLAIRARNMLRDLDARLIGVVVNGVGEGKSYKYGYKYGYGNYGDSDPRESISSYYDDRDEPKANGDSNKLKATV